MEKTDEAGFSLLGVLIAVMIIGVVATIAVPKFNSMIVMANTSKIQADLSTLDAAVAVYEAQEGNVPTELSQLKDYVNDVEKLKPPVGECFLKDSDGKAVKHTIKDTAYRLVETEHSALGPVKTRRAACDDHFSGDFGK
ncbi:general secretion pathway protein G [Selenomonas sp. GACV-9]|nr:general secretion pathway protein G [Selenomonas ruminantium]